MSHVIPIEPALRRRRELPARPTERPTGRPIERGVAIPLHVETERAIRPRTTPRAVRERPMTDNALAARFFPLVALIAALDLGTKAWAVSALATRSTMLAPFLSLSLAFNRASAGGVSLGDHTRALNFSATGVIVGMVIMLAPTLTSLDRRVWRALALIAGAGIGNLVSLARGERGVPDFIALQHAGGAWVLNLADVALVVGLVLLARTVVSLARGARGAVGTAPLRVGLR